MACFDTDFLIDLDRKNREAMSKIEELASHGELASTTIINVAEYYGGAFQSGKKKNAVENARQYLKDFSILMLDEQSALLWGKLHVELKSNTIGDRDLFIAAIALSNNETLITRNAKHYGRVQALTLER